MNSTLKNTALVLSVIILLPLISFSVYQLNSLSENEKVLERIYTEQLNTIIFSVNQYVDDIVQNWTREIKDSWDNRESGNLVSRLTDILKDNGSISMMLISDTAGNIGSNFYTIQGSAESPKAEKRMGAVLNDNKDKIASLIDVRELGYNRIEPLTNRMMILPC